MSQTAANPPVAAVEQGDEQIRLQEVAGEARPAESRPAGEADELASDYRIVLSCGLDSRPHR